MTKTAATASPRSKPGAMSAKRRMTTTTRPSSPTKRPTPGQRLRSTRRPSPDVPDGLRLFFSALQSQEYCEEYGATTPDAFLRIYAGLRHEPSELDRVLADAIDGDYSEMDGRPASEHVGLATIGAFWAGVAAAWFALQAFNGHGGAR